LRFQFDTSRLIANEDHAGVEMPVRYRHRETSVPLETTIANFWTFEDGWPTKLTSITISSASRRSVSISPRSFLVRECPTARCAPPQQVNIKVGSMLR